MRSDMAPQKKRPSALNNATPPYVAATIAGVRLVSSCIMGTALLMTRIPAVTFRNNISHSR